MLFQMLFKVFYIVFQFFPFIVFGLCLPPFLEKKLGLAYNDSVLWLRFYSKPIQKEKVVITMHQNMPPETARTWVEIDLSALRSNLNLAKKTKKKVMCVVKANAYGHGAVRVSRFLEANGADAFAVSCLEEALELRQNGITLPVLILGHTPAKYAAVLAANSVAQTVVSLEAAKALNAEAEKADVTLTVHLKIDTGMSRLGILCQKAGNVSKALHEVLQIRGLPRLSCEGIFTHLSVADTPEEEDYTRAQLHNFNFLLSELAQKGVRFPLQHAANSAGILNYPEAHFNMVREGIMLYGLYPDSAPREDGPLRPVMSMKTRIAQIREFPKGTTISYGRTYTLPSDAKVAVLGAGYADGYPRRLSGKGSVSIKGASCPQIGTICMDMCMADVSALPNVKEGDAVVLFGHDGMSLEQISQIVGTINYELCCLITNRAHRVYTGG